MRMDHTRKASPLTPRGFLLGSRHANPNTHVSDQVIETDLGFVESMDIKEVQVIHQAVGVSPLREFLPAPKDNKGSFVDCVVRGENPPLFFPSSGVDSRHLVAPTDCHGPQSISGPGRYLGSTRRTCWTPSLAGGKGHHTKCRPSEHTPPGVRRNRRSDMPQTLRDGTDKLTTTRCSPGPIPPTAQSRRSPRAALMECRHNQRPAQTAQANEDEEVDNWAESELAWELANAISASLSDRVRAQLYATLGSGDSYTAIDTVLQTMAHQISPMAPELVAQLTNWLDAYTHSEDAPRLHELLRAIRALRWWAVELCYVGRGWLQHAGRRRRRRTAQTPRAIL